MFPDSRVHGPNMGPINLVVRVDICGYQRSSCWLIHRDGTSSQTPVRNGISMVSVNKLLRKLWRWHYDDVIMGAIASQITSLTIVYSTVYTDADQRNHQSSASLAFVRGSQIRGPVNSPHKWPVTRKMSPFDDVIMKAARWNSIIMWCDTPHLLSGPPGACPDVQNAEVLLVWVGPLYSRCCMAMSPIFW